MRKRLIPMNLQFFAQPDAGQSGNGQGGTAGQQENGQNGNAGNQQSGTPAFDYEKLAGIISGKQTVTEEMVLKNYFKQQGLSPDEMASAIKAFKEEKAKNTPDPAALQARLTETGRELLESRIKNEATLQAMALGLDAKTIPYVIKLAELGNAVNAEGKIDAEEVKKALTQVLTDVPALKGSGQADNNGRNASGMGGFQIGQQQGNNGQSQDDILRDIFGIRKQ